MAAPYGEDTEPDVSVGVDDRVMAMQRYVDADREFQSQVRAVKERQDCAEKARVMRDQAKQQIVSMLGLEPTLKLPEYENVAEQIRRFPAGM